MTSKVMMHALSLGLLFLCGVEAQAEQLHYWCAPNKRADVTWKKEVIRPPLTEVLIDTNAKTLYLKEDGDVVAGFKDGVSHDDSDPHFGVVEQVFFRSGWVDAYSQKMGPGGPLGPPLGRIMFDLRTPALKASNSIVEQYCAATPDEAIARVRSEWKSICARLKEQLAEQLECIKACRGMNQYQCGAGCQPLPISVPSIEDCMAER
jgi:hypothetical protein